MDDEIRNLRADFIMLRTVTVSLWSNVLADRVSGPQATARRLSEQMRSEFGSILKDGDGSQTATLENTIHEMQDRLETFWESV